MIHRGANEEKLSAEELQEFEPVRGVSGHFDYFCFCLWRNWVAVGVN